AHSIRLALGAATDQVVVTSTKSMTGHLLGAAGALETLATVLALRDRVVPPTINLVDPEEGLDLDIAANATRTLPAGDLAALNNSFGFGGHNVAVAVTNENVTA
ncbi:MAG: beta-ketoacyl-ACP synthase, partial [Propioniciclava sp.]